MTAMQGPPDVLGPADKLAVLTRAAGLLSSTTEFRSMLGHVIGACLPSLGDAGFFDLRIDGDEVVRTARAHEDPVVEEVLRPTRWLPQIRADINLCALSSGCAALHPRIDDAWRERVAATPAHLATMKRMNFRSMITVPMRFGDELVGSLTLFFGSSGRHHDERHLAFAQELAALVVPTVVNARLVERQRRTQEALERARADAETANRAKDEFLAILGHELRNPLAPISSALKLLDLRGDVGTQRERAVIHRQVAHLSRLVDDLLDVSRIVRGKVEFARDHLDLRTVVENALEMTRPMFAERGVLLDTDLGDAPRWVTGDSVRLAQVTGNLLTNAAKFSAAGQTVELTLATSSTHHTLRVRDQGAGIEPALLPHVFDLFVQGEQGLARERGGLGLGLAIVANLVDRHGGTVRASSDGAGRGAAFEVELPHADVSLPRSPTPPPRPAPAPSTGRVLLVDDNTDAADLLAEVLREYGYQTEVAATPAEALQAATSFLPQLAILDIGLPGMTGYELARRLREMPELGELRLIALSGYSANATAASRFDRHLVKPIDPDALADVMGALLTAR